MLFAHPRQKIDRTYNNNFLSEKTYISVIIIPNFHIPINKSMYMQLNGKISSELKKMIIKIELLQK